MIDLGVVEDDFPDLFRAYHPRNRVFDRDDRGMDGRVNPRAIFKAPVHLSEGAVNQGQPVDVAKSLEGGDVATDEGQVFGVPREILPLDLAILKDAILAVPKGILGNDFGMANPDVFRPVKGVVAVVKAKGSDIRPNGFLAKVGARVDGHVLKANILIPPQGFLGNRENDVSKG